MNDYTVEELAEMLARYRYNAKLDADRIAALEATVAKLYARIAELEKPNA